MVWPLDDKLAPGGRDGGGGAAAQVAAEVPGPVRPPPPAARGADPQPGGRLPRGTFMLPACLPASSSFSGLGAVGVRRDSRGPRRARQNPLAARTSMPHGLCFVDVMSPVAQGHGACSPRCSLQESFSFVMEGVFPREGEQVKNTMSRMLKSYLLPRSFCSRA